MHESHLWYTSVFLISPWCGKSRQQAWSLAGTFEGTVWTTWTRKMCKSYLLKKKKGARFQFIDCKHDVSWQAEMLGKLSAFQFTSEAMVVLNNLLGPRQPPSAEVLRGCLSQAQHWSFIFHKQVTARRGPLVTGAHTHWYTTNDPYFNLRADVKGWGKCRGGYKRRNPACAMAHCLQEPHLPQLRTTEYYSAIKKNEGMPRATTWMGLEIPSIHTKWGK